MKDYYKEMEELLNPMKKFNEQMEAITNPMKGIMDSIKPIELPTIDYSIPSLDFGIKPITLSQVGLSIPTYVNPFEELQKQMVYNLNPLKKLQEEMEYTLNPFKNLESTIAPIKSILSSLELSNLTEIQKALQELDTSSFKIEASVEQEIEEQIESLPEEEKKTLDEIFLALKDTFPEIVFISEAFSKKQYVRILTYFLIFIYPFIYTQYQEQKKMISDSYYKINRNKVRVRTEPTTQNPESIITKLNKNVFVEKIDSHRNWLKIEFENDNGDEVEGWVRRDKVVKIEE